MCEDGSPKVEVEFYPLGNGTEVINCNETKRYDIKGIGFERDVHEEQEIEKIYIEYKIKWNDPVRNIRVIERAVLVKVKVKGKLINRLYDNEEIVAEWE